MASFGPPFVITYDWVKIWNVPMMLVTSTKKIVGDSSGSVIDTNWRSRPAPSTWAAS